MPPHDSPSCTAFDGPRLVASGPLAEVALAAKQALDAGAQGPLLVFDDASSQPVEIDFRGTPKQVLARLARDTATPVPAASRGPGRPKLGVTAREVTLLPRHWEWLSRQRGGSSATLRKLVEDALRKGRGAADHHDAAFHFLSVMAGDLPKFEDAVREIYAGNRTGYDHFSQGWPAGIRDHGRKLAFPHA